MDNCTYNKLKLIHEMSRLTGFIDKFARKDAKQTKHKGCDALVEEVYKDLKKSIRKLHKAVDPSRI
ncbi:MAG: hypothetical protein AB1668_06230 [Nanoarchaeota archaeon]